jgi:hypothetical protein
LVNFIGSPLIGWVRFAHEGAALPLVTGIRHCLAIGPPLSDFDEQDKGGQYGHENETGQMLRNFYRHATCPCGSRRSAKMASSNNVKANGAFYRKEPDTCAWPDARAAPCQQLRWRPLYLENGA